MMITSSEIVNFITRRKLFEHLYIHTLKYHNKTCVKSETRHRIKQAIVSFKHMNIVSG